MYDKIIFLNSRVIDNETKTGKVPSSDIVEYGEIAINYKTGYETISFKNDNGVMVTIPSNATVEQLLDGSVRKVFNQSSIPTSPKNGDIWIY